MMPPTSVQMGEMNDAETGTVRPHSLCVDNPGECFGS